MTQAATWLSRGCFVCMEADYEHTACHKNLQQDLFLFGAGIGRVPSLAASQCLRRKELIARSH